MKQVIIKNERKQIIHSKKIKFIIIFIFIILIISFQQCAFATIENNEKIDIKISKSDYSDVKNDDLRRFMNDPQLAESTSYSSDVAIITNTIYEDICPNGRKDKYVDRFIEVLENLLNNDSIRVGDQIGQTDLYNIKNLIKRMDGTDPNAGVAAGTDDKWDLTETQKNKVKKLKEKLTGTQETSEDNIAEQVPNIENEIEQSKNDKIYRWPNTVDVGRTTDGTLQDMINDAGNFLSAGTDEKIEKEDLNSLSGSLYNILLEIGVGISVILGLILGIKMMLAGVEEKAEVKKMMWIYLVGCIVVFGSFGIWKIVVTILEQI